MHYFMNEVRILYLFMQIDRCVLIEQDSVGYTDKYIIMLCIEMSVMDNTFSLHGVKCPIHLYCGKRQHHYHHVQQYRSSMDSIHSLHGIICFQLLMFHTQYYKVLEVFIFFLFVYYNRFFNNQ